MSASWPPWYVWASILFTQWAFWFKSRHQNDQERSLPEESEIEILLTVQTIEDPDKVAENPSTASN